MAKFRTSHTKQKMGSGNSAVKIGLFAAIIGGLFWIFNHFLGDKVTPEPPGENTEKKEESSIEKEMLDYYLPTSTTGEVIKHRHFALSYSEEHEQAEWVAHELTRENLNKNWAERPDNFRPDPKVSKASASTRDYIRTGYNRGHLVPAGDMAFSEEAISETFYMSNISPQIRNFNGGVWRELEENVRDWARKFRHLYVVTGPVLTTGIREEIGGNRVSVPDLFYKVILDYSEPEIKAIAFLIPNEKSVKPLRDYAVSIDKVEALTGIDFFHQLLEEEEEMELESQFDVALWPLNVNLYRVRVEKWNKDR